MQKRLKDELILEGVNHVFASPSTPVPGATSVATHKSKESAAKDVGKDVIHSRATPAAFPQALFSISVVKFLLFGVAQHLVGKADFFKLLRDRKGKKMRINVHQNLCNKFVRENFAFNFISHLKDDKNELLRNYNKSCSEFCTNSPHKAVQ